MSEFRPEEWYRVLTPGDEPAEQGEQFFDLVVRFAVQDPETGVYNIGKETGDVIVATHTCDIKNRKVSRIEVVPVYPLEQWLYEQPEMLNDLEGIRRGMSAGYYLLPGWPQAPQIRARATRIVCFDEKLSISWAELKTAMQETRLGLKSPYKEHFGQALARFYMRVGLPEDMPSMTWKPVPTAVEPEKRIMLSSNDFTALNVPPLRSSSLGIAVQKLRLQAQNETLYKARLKDYGTWFGVGETVESARLSLLHLIERKYQGLRESSPDLDVKEIDYLSTLFPAPVAPRTE
ncbi:MAG: hypothetical protein M1358_04480 [Chloroflexi bacterium]|nr:hypothetical protein [Chloroflexota bacterium]